MPRDKTYPQSATCYPSAFDANSQFMNNPGTLGHFLDPRSWHWDVLAILGFCAQALFASRFIIQWIASERRKRSHIPIHFWYLSLCGGILMTVYGLLRRDPVIILGQAPGLIVYVRNLVLIHRHNDADEGTAESTARDRA